MGRSLTAGGFWWLEPTLGRVDWGSWSVCTRRSLFGFCAHAVAVEVVSTTVDARQMHRVDGSRPRLLQIDGLIDC